MKINLIVLRQAVYCLLFCFGLTKVQGQMRVGQPAGSPDGSASLDVSSGPYSSGSVYRGIAPPKVTLIQTTQAAPITSPITGLLVYNTVKVSDVVPGYYYWDGNRWILLGETTQALTTAVTADKIAQLFAFGKNLFNKNDPKNEQRKYIDNTGGKVANSNYMTSNYIHIKGNTNYTVSNIQYLTFYAADTTVNLGGELYNRTNATTTSPARAAYAKLTVPYNILATFQFQEGNLIDDTGIYSAKLAVLNGKTVWWCGTSIPASGKYPEMACSMNGAKCINKAVGSSSARKAKADGSIAGISWQAAMWNLSSTIAEKQALINNWDNIKTGFLPDPSLPATLSQAQKDTILHTSYEHRLIPYLNGTYPMPDLFVFNHNFNDQFSGETDTQFAAIPANRLDRNTYIGAINFLINEIIKANPRAQIAFISHYEKQLYPRLAAADETLAAYWQFPILRLYEKTGWSQQPVPGTQPLWNQPPYNIYGPRPGESISNDMSVQRVAIPDGVHPSSDPTRKSQELLGRIVGNFLSEL